MNNEGNNEIVIIDAAGPSNILIEKLDENCQQAASSGPEDFSFMCRICALKTRNIMNLFEDEGAEQKLVEKINKYLPLKVSQGDGLPEVICYQCSNAVLAWHELVECCMQADASFRKQLVLAAQGNGISSTTKGSVNHLDEDSLNLTKEEIKREVCTANVTMEVKNNASRLYTLKKNGRKYGICEICNKEVMISSWKRHERSHLEEKSYSCDACGLGFKDSGNLARHKRAIHNNHRPYTCNVCSKTFSRNGHLEEHLKSHSDSRNYVCDLCGKASKSSNALRMHRRIHVDVHAFQCMFCWAKFKRKSELYAHVTVHTGEKSHACECGKAFRLRSQLNSHARTHKTDEC